MIDKHQGGKQLSPRRYSSLEYFYVIMQWLSALSPEQESFVGEVDQEINHGVEVDPRKLQKRKDLLRMKYDSCLMSKDEQKQFFRMRELEITKD